MSFSSDGEDSKDLTASVNQLSAEQLRDELRALGCATTGLKNELRTRLLGELTKTGVTHGMASSPIGKAATPRRASASLQDAGEQLDQSKSVWGKRREPRRDDFEREEDFNAAWIHWREMRDSNNDSVKRSRENAKRKRQEYETECKQRESENSQLESTLSMLNQEVVFLSKVLTQPYNLSHDERIRLERVLVEEQHKEFSHGFGEM